MSLAPAASAAAAVADRGEIVARRRQAQQRQAAVGVACAQPVERRAGARQRVGEVGGRDTFRADALRARSLDRLDERHSGHGVIRARRITDRPLRGRNDLAAD